MYRRHCLDPQLRLLWSCYVQCSLYPQQRDFIKSTLLLMKSKIEEDIDLFVSLFGGILYSICSIKHNKSVGESHKHPIQISIYHSKQCYTIEGVVFCKTVHFRVFLWTFIHFTER